jgi:hypothetical protein
MGGDQRWSSLLRPPATDKERRSIPDLTPEAETGNLKGLVSNDAYSLLLPYKKQDARLFQQKAILWIAMWHDVFPEFDSVSEKRMVADSLSTFDRSKFRQAMHQ